jgi:hypothetical protein
MIGMALPLNSYLRENIFCGCTRTDDIQKGDISLVFLSRANGNLCPFVRPFCGVMSHQNGASPKKQSCLRA